MQTVTIHDVPFKIQDDIEITKELMAQMEAHAKWHIQRPTCVRIRPDTGKRVLSFINEKQIRPGAKERKILIDGIETKLVADGVIETDITQDDIANAIAGWTAEVYVDRDEHDQIVMDSLI